MFGIDELGMDLGTSTLHIVVKGKGVVLSEPAYVAYDRQTRDVVAVGEEARRMYGTIPTASWSAPAPPIPRPLPWAQAARAAQVSAM